MTKTTTVLRKYVTVFCNGNYFNALNVLQILTKAKSFCLSWPPGFDKLVDFYINIRRVLNKFVVVLRSL